MDRKMKRGDFGTMRQGSNVLLGSVMFSGSRQGHLSIRLRFLLPSCSFDIGSQAAAETW